MFVVSSETHQFRKALISYQTLQSQHCTLAENCDLNLSFGSLDSIRDAQCAEYTDDALLFRTNSG